MPSPWFKALPLDRSRSETRRVEAALIAGYDDLARLLDLVDKAGLSRARLVIHMVTIDNLVPQVMGQARRAERLLQLLLEVLRDPSMEALHGEIRAVMSGHEAELAAAALDHRPSLAVLTNLPSSMEVWAQTEPRPVALAPRLEQVINGVAGFEEPVEFRRQLALAEVRTARIEIGGHAAGTGVLVSPRHILTNRHVVEHVTNNGAARFDFKMQPGGAQASPGRVVRFAADWEATKSDHRAVAEEVGEDGPAPGASDFALVRLAEPVGEQAVGIDPMASGAETRGFYTLDGSPYTYVAEEPVRIVGHPSGRPAQFSYASPSQLRRTLAGHVYDIKLTPREAPLARPYSTRNGGSLPCIRPPDRRRRQVRSISKTDVSIRGFRSPTSWQPFDWPSPDHPNSAISACSDQLGQALDTVFGAVACRENINQQQRLGQREIQRNRLVP